jgi:hypothetical protein
MAQTVTKKKARVEEDENSLEERARLAELDASIKRSIADLKAGRLVRYR